MLLCAVLLLRCACELEDEVTYVPLAWFSAGAIRLALMQVSPRVQVQCRSYHTCAIRVRYRTFWCTAVSLQRTAVLGLSLPGQCLGQLWLP